MIQDSGNESSVSPASAIFQRRKFLTHLSAVAAGASGLSACGGGRDAVDVTVGEGGLSFSDNTLNVTVGVPATIMIRNRTLLPSGNWTITAPSPVTASPSSGGSVSAGNSVTITLTASAVGSFAVQVKVGALPAETLTVSATPAPTPAPGGSYFIDFTTTPAQNPLSAGGVWTNNTQGTGGNVAMNAQSSMRVIAAVSGGINMAGGDATGQSAPPAVADYMDSFAFVPGFSGNQRITAVIYVDPAGYTPVANHELELLLGCSSVSGSRQWISCTWNRDGARVMALMNGPANGFTILNPVDNGGFGTALADADVWVAELNRSTNTVITKRNGVVVQSLTDGGFAGHGSGIGIGSFRRTVGGGSAANRYGFRSVRCEAF